MECRSGHATDAFQALDFRTMSKRPEKLWQRGMEHLRQGNVQAAQAIFESLVATEPGSAEARFRLSLVHASQGRFNAAVALASRAVALDAARSEFLPHLANFLLMCGQPEAARAVATRAVAQCRDDARALDQLAAVMARLGEQVMATELFDQAIALRPGNSSLRFNRGLAHRQFGAVALAENDFEASVQLSPAHAKAHWALADLRSHDLASNHIDRLRALLARAPSPSVDEELLSLALFKELDDLGEYEAAWSELERGIASRSRRWLATTLPLLTPIDSAIAVCGDDFAAGSGPAQATGPVFIFGMPRSGVALLGKLLSRHSRIHHISLQQPFFRLLSRRIGRDSVRPFDAQDLQRCLDVDFEALGKEYLREVSPAEGKQLLVCESQPMNFLLAGFIARAFPGARMLNMIRDPIDTCVSILALPGSEPALHGHDPQQLATSHVAYQRLMQHWHRLLPGKIMDVSYESLVERPEMVLRVVCAFLGIRYGSALRMNLQLSQRSIGRGRRYANRMPDLQAVLSESTGVAT